MRRRLTLPILVCATIAAALSPLTRAGAAEHTVEIKGLSFIPEDLAVAAGDTVTWVNLDEDDHDLGGGVDSPIMKQGQRFAFTFDRVGEVAYHCRIHTYMQGLIRVGGPDGSPPPSSGELRPDPVPSTTTTANFYPPLGMLP